MSTIEFDGQTIEAPLDLVLANGPASSDEQVSLTWHRGDNPRDTRLNVVLTGSEVRRVLAALRRSPLAIALAKDS